MTPTLIVTRPAAQGASFAADIAARWDGPLAVIQSPLLEIVPVAVDVGKMDAVIFTSVNGVAATVDMGLRHGMQAWCVGEQTALAAKNAGFDAICGPGDADGLIRTLLSAHPKGILAHIRGMHARGDISAALNAAGLCCQDVVAYDQRALSLSPQAKSAVNGTAPVIFPLFSPRTSTILLEQGPFVAPVYLVAISQAVADAFDPAQVIGTMVASSPDANTMQHAVLAMLAEIAATLR